MYNTVTTENITFQDAPRWMIRYCVRVHKLLTPEWTLTIKRLRPKQLVDPNDKTCEAKVDLSRRYHEADIVFSNRIRDNVSGRRNIIHEFVHLLLANLISAAKLAGKMRSRDTTTHAEDIEEQTVTKIEKFLEVLL